MIRKVMALKIEIAMEPGLPDEDAVEFMREFLEETCDFEACSIEVLESHDCVVFDLSWEPNN